MSDTEALKIFSRQPVSPEMVQFLVATTSSIIQVKQPKTQYAPVGLAHACVMVAPAPTTTLLAHFIKNLIRYSNVQTPTLMATLVYLNKLRNLLPANAVGMETTRHRIFLAALILSAKLLNDLSPLNKHWTKYTDGLLTNEEVNMAERELIALLKWNVVVRDDELYVALQPFLTTIKQSLRQRLEEECTEKTGYYRLSNTYANRGLCALSTTLSFASLNLSASAHSLLSLQSTQSAQLPLQAPAPHKNYAYRAPLAAKTASTLNVPRKQEKDVYDRLDAADVYYHDTAVNLMNSGRVVV